ncbi:Protein kinase domain family protein [Leishmania donovani]|uniref:Protein kinase domain family protein n=1 Tax=Leishmania donovani TaxID=5661 RepID=A0A504X810_LEIDO|nr:Protein kinase domain family protein [Leishmania donovani]
MSQWQSIVLLTLRHRLRQLLWQNYVTESESEMSCSPRSSITTPAVIEAPRVVHECVDVNAAPLAKATRLAASYNSKSSPPPCAGKVSGPHRPQSHPASLTSSSASPCFDGHELTSASHDFGPPLHNFSGSDGQAAMGPILFAEATTVHYRGSVYHGLTEEMLQRGGSTFSIQVSIPTFPTNITLVRSIMMSILTSNVRLVDDAGTFVRRMQPAAQGEAAAHAFNHTKAWLTWRRFVKDILSHSEIEVSPNGHAVKVRFASGKWVLPAQTSALIVPCLPFSLFEQLGRLGVQDLPNNCLAGDPFFVSKKSFLQLDEARWNPSQQVLVTGGPISIPLAGTSSTVSDKAELERRLRVMEGYTCLHTRSAFVRGSRWDVRGSVYRFTPHRGGMQTLCYVPYPDTLPFLSVKLMDSYEVAGPEGVSTDPPQVHADLEFSGTIYGTNLTERDTVVITDELCADFTSQNVFFVDLFFSSSSRVSFFGTFHKRGIYHVCYHREGSPMYVLVSTLLVERGADVVIDNDSPNVLIDQDVKLLQSASVSRLNVQDKGNLNLRQRSLNVSYFLWSGGSISGRGTINCTGYAKITTQGYETRLLSVPLYNYGEMTIDVQRLSMERDGAIHNYGNLTLAVSSMGVDSISSVLSAGRRNAITNYPGGVIRIMALDERSYALLTGRFIFQGGSVLLLGKINLTDASSFADSTVTLKSGTLLTTHKMHLGGAVVVEERSVLTLMKGCVFVSATVSGDGVVRLLGDDVVLNSLTVTGSIRALFGVGMTDPISVIAYGTTHFGEDTLVHVTNANFVTSSGLAKVTFLGRLLADFVTVRFTGNMILQIGGVAALYGNMSGEALNFRRTLTKLSGYSLPLAMASFVSRNATMFVIDTFRLDEAVDASARGGSSTAKGIVSSLDPFNKSIFSGPAAVETQACEVYLPTSQRLTVSGRLVLRGCVQVPAGGTISGAVVKLEDSADWELLHQTFCIFADPETLPHLCRHNRRSVPPLRSGLALSEKVYVRSPASFLLDELTLVHSHTRVTESVPITIKDTIIVRVGSTLVLAYGIVMAARHIIIEGTLVVNDPRNTVLKGLVEVKEEGIIELRGVSGMSCANELLVEGRLYLAPNARGFHFRCLSASDDDIGGEDSEAAPADPEGGETMKPMGRLDALLRKRALANLRPDMTCPDDVVHDYDSRRQFINLYWMRQAYDPPADQPTRRDMIWMTLFGIACCFGTFHILLTMWGYTYKKWWSDIRTPCPLQLTLTWDELSYSAVNYFSFCRFIIIHLLNTMAAFHPGLPAPLPSVAGMLLRGMGLLMPHHQTPISRPRKVGIFYIVWLFTFLYVKKRGSWLISYLRRRHPYLLDVVQKLYTVLTILNFIFLAPLMSSVVDAIAWPTLLRNVPTYELMQQDIWVAISIISFLSMGVMAPSSILTNQMFIPHMDLRVRASNMFVHFAAQMWETVMWKVFYNNPMCVVFNCIFFQFIRLAFLLCFPATPYKNVNRFMMFLLMQPFLVYLAIILYVVLVRTGVYTSCTQGTDLFRVVAAAFVISLFVNFWRNVLFTQEQTTATGDVSIDALRCSMTQIRNRIHDLKFEVYACTDAMERENILNAIARMRIEYLEKQERYRFETHRILRPFFFSGTGFDGDTHLQSHSSVASYSNDDGDDASNVHPAMSPNMQQGTLLSVEEMETFSCGPALGKGSYGTVHLGILTNGKMVAVKYVNVVSESPEALASVEAEVNMLRELSHPNIIRYFGAHTIQDTMLVFMEFAVGGSLTSIVKKFTHLTEPVMQLYTFQILKGLQYLHDKGVVHRDIKGENILIDGYGVAKLADFGCSKSLANIANSSQVGCGTLVGSPFWMAPEVIRSEAYGTKADIWSVGCTVVEMLNGGEPPWREEFDNVYSAMFYVGSTNDIPQIPAETSDPCRDFLFRCFERDVMKRASADELLQHPWLKSAAAASHAEDSSDNFLSFSTVSSPSLKSAYDGHRTAGFSRSTPHSSREDLTSPLNGSTAPQPPNGSIASITSNASKKFK